MARPVTPIGSGIVEAGISEMELATLALDADPDAPFDADAVPFLGDTAGADLLPEWYMPVSGSITRTRPRVVAVAAIILSLIVVNGAGLCVTYGLPEIAW